MIKLELIGGYIMPSTKLLRGLPSSLIDSYMNTLCYYKKGYMADWLYNGMIELEIDDVIIDVLDETIFPNEMSIIPLNLNIPRLKEIIQRTLLSNGFDSGYIQSSKLLLKFIKPRSSIYCVEQRLLT